MKNIDLSKEFGAYLKTRFLGERLLGQIKSHLKSEEEICIDFSRVAGISHSFADECFGELFGEFGPELFQKRVHLTGLNEAGKSVLRLVFTDRSGKRPA